ncbi:unnamed protein product [Bemisia tabaci]|uniref:Uncharacterized protein n=1 Tax=Bemisia tabaci TaxID=7038 RepID=A0A9P0A0C4_BEMTA|nr:unnamed protein product [Bemisia tabaci]
MVNWLDQHDIFPQIKELIAINSGISGTDNINCHLAREIGAKGIAKLIGEDYDTLKFKRNERCIPLANVSCAICVEDVITPIDPHMLFRRICVAKKSDEELEECLKYELSPFPLSMFTEEGMYKGTKSTLYESFTPITLEINTSNAMYVIDGGFLLHRVLWARGLTFSSICKNYVSYVKSHYHSSLAIVVFDGYPSDADERSTKYMERLRRKKRLGSVDILFDESMIPSVSQETFLSNDKNKDRLIKILMSYFHRDNMRAMQAEEDADTLIITTAIQHTPTYETVIVVGDRMLI